MSVTVEKKFAVAVVYNGITKPFEVDPEEQVRALLQQAIAAFGVTQQPHLLGLFRTNGSEVPDNESVERAGLKPGEVLLLRPSAGRGGQGGCRRWCGASTSQAVAFWLRSGQQLAYTLLDTPSYLWPQCEGAGTHASRGSLSLGC